MRQLQEAAQQKLVNRNIRLIGLGGIGGILARFLARFLETLAPDSLLYLIDGDTFELRNRARMEFHSLGNKAVVTAQQLAHACPRLRVGRVIDKCPDALSPGDCPGSGSSPLCPELWRTHAGGCRAVALHQPGGGLGHAQCLPGLATAGTPPYEEVYVDVLLGRVLPVTRQLAPEADG